MAQTPTGRPRGNPPRPTEVKRRLGNPGKRALPDERKVTILPGTNGEAPQPRRPLGVEGRKLWDAIWRGAPWLSRDGDHEQALVLCEHTDERLALREAVMRDGDWRQRAALRQIDAQVFAGLAALGLTPTDRARLGVAEVRQQSKIEQLLAAKANAGS